MTINTSPLHKGNGGIFSDRYDGTDPRRIEIGWQHEDSCNNCINFEIKPGGNFTKRMTHVLNKGQNYDIAINFDGKFCEFYIDGNSVGEPIDCVKGVGTVGSPTLCYTKSGGFFGWIGSITNLRFKGSKGKLSNITLHI